MQEGPKEMKRNCSHYPGRQLLAFVLIHLLIAMPLFAASNPDWGVNAKRDADNHRKTKSNQKSYLLDITEFVNSNNEQPTGGFENEIGQLVSLLSPDVSKNPFLIDEYADRRELIVNDLAIHILTLPESAGVSKKRVVKLLTEELVNDDDFLVHLHNSLQSIERDAGNTVLYVEDFGFLSRIDPTLGTHWR